MNKSSNGSSDKDIKPVVIVLSCSDTLLEEFLEPDKLDAFAFIPLSASKNHLAEIIEVLKNSYIRFQFTTLTGQVTKEQMEILIKIDLGEIISSKDEKLTDHSTRETISNMSQLQNPIPISKINTNDFSGIIFPHHLGVFQDIYNSDHVGRLVREFYDARKPICAIGYGVWGLCASDSSENLQIQSYNKKNWCLNGTQLTGISQNEEFRQPYFGKLPNILQDLIEDKGGEFVQFKPDESSCVIDRNIITGPNEISTTLCIHNFCWFCTKS